MKKIVSLSVMAIFLLLVQGSFAQEQMSDSVQQVKMMEYMELAQPGPEHQELAKLEGKWDLTISYWMKPGTDPMVLTTPGECKMILGGRFLELTSDGEFMGMPMQTLHILGFDRRNNEYISSGFDTQGTYGVHATGTKLDEGNIIRLYGSDYDGFWDFTQEYYFDIDIIDNDNFSWSVTFTDEAMAQGQDAFKMVEIKYTRVK